MSLLRDRLIEDYAEHFARVNENIDPRKVHPDRFQHMDANYGELVRPLAAGDRVLDLGCGSGILLYWLSRQGELAPVGVDSSSSQIAVAREALPDAEVHCEDGLEFLESRPDSFAGIFCTDVLEHLPSKDLTLRWVETARQALQPGGFFYCRMPNAASLLGSYSRYRDLTHECSFTSTSILQLLEAGGLTDCRVLPIRGTDFSGRCRLKVEFWLHKILFRICGVALETVFTSNVCAVGYRAR